MQKLLAAVLALILTTSILIMVGAVSAQSIPKPSVPEFTLKIEDYGIRVEIQNQPIVPNGQDTADIFYDIRYKWNDSTNWFNGQTPEERSYISQLSGYDKTILYVSANSYYEILGSSSSHQVDYQIRAINGYLDKTPKFAPPIGSDLNNLPVIVVSSSEWSDTRTVTIPVRLQPQDIMAPVVIAGLIAAIVIVSLFAYLAKHKEWK